MAYPAEGKGHGEIAVKPDGNSADDRAALKAKINNIWEELNGKDSLPAKVGLPKVQAVKPSKPSKVVPSWMASLGLVPPRRSFAYKSDQIQGDKSLKLANGDASNGVHKDSPITSGEHLVEAQEIRKSPQISLKVNEVRSRLRRRADTTTSTASENSKDSTAQTLERKLQMQASSSSGLDDLLQQISKKQKPNILDRSRMDWGQFKEEKGLEDELEAYKKSGDKYLDKVAFLQRSDVREYENERCARLALQSKRESETSL